MKIARTFIVLLALVFVGSVWVYTQTQNTVPKYGPSGTLVNSSIIDSGNNVGIGATASSAHLSVGGSATGAVGILVTQDSDDTVGVSIWRDASSTATSRARLQFCNLDTGILCSYVSQDKTIGGLSLHASSPATPDIQVTTTGSVGIGTTTPSAKLHVAGNVIVDGNIGAKYQDVAEWVDAGTDIPAGSVVVADRLHANRVHLSEQSYDTAVAGVISARPGIVLGEKAAGRVTVAQSGRVRVRVDASFGAVTPGDLLVTSPTPGYAMKSEPIQIGGTHLHRPGTILGKALEPLREGQREVLVLLTLQ